MIWFDGVDKRYRSARSTTTILSNASFVFPAGHNVGILGGNGAGKSTLIRLIAGAEDPDRGNIRSEVRVSFPLGFSGTFHPNLSGRQNAVFLARAYGEDTSRVVDFVADFAELGPYLDMPINTYSSGMLAKLAFGASLAIDFDVYLIDEVTEVGDARFRQKCAAYFADRMTRSDIIMVSHSTHTIKAYCDMGAVLHDGQLDFYESVGDALHAYRNLMGAADA